MQRSLNPMNFAAAGLMALAAVGCGPDESPSEAEPDAGPGPSCTLAYLGDPAAEPELEIIALDAGYTTVPIADGSSIALMFPPQGGRVVFAGARVRNVDPCAVTVTGVLRDLASEQTTFDTRTVNLKPLDSGWGGSVEGDISTFSNIPICPNQWAASDAFNREFELKVTVKDRDQHSASKTVLVTPTCAEPEFESQCKCICKEGYVLGETCKEPAPELPGPAPGSP